MHGRLPPASLIPAACVNHFANHRRAFISRVAAADATHRRRGKHDAGKGKEEELLRVVKDCERTAMLLCGGEDYERQCRKAIYEEEKYCDKIAQRKVVEESV